MQRLLLNFGIFSRIYENRKQAGYKGMPDGHGGEKLYITRAGHELVISKSNLLRFRDEMGFVSADQETPRPSNRSWKERWQHTAHAARTASTSQLQCAR